MKSMKSVVTVQMLGLGNLEKSLLEFCWNIYLDKRGALVFHLLRKCPLRNNQPSLSTLLSREPRPYSLMVPPAEMPVWVHVSGRRQ